MVCLNKFEPKQAFDSKARIAGVEIKIVDGGVMKLVDPTRRVIKVIKSFKEYKAYCRRYY